MTETTTQKPRIALIAAMDEGGAIGLGGDMPWAMSMKSDLKHFRTTTMGHPILMGRTTYESFPKRPLPGRYHIVLTGRKDYPAPEGVAVVPSIEEGLKAWKEQGDPLLFVIGGAKVFDQMIDRADLLYLTLIHHRYPEADTFFPEIDPEEWQLTETEEHPADETNAHPYTFVVLERK